MQRVIARAVERLLPFLLADTSSENVERQRTEIGTRFDLIFSHRLSIATTSINIVFLVPILKKKFVEPHVGNRGEKQERLNQGAQDGIFLLWW